MTIKIYDGPSDEMRDITQEDVDQLLDVQRAFGLTRQILKNMAQPRSGWNLKSHLNFLKKLSEIE